MIEGGMNSAFECICAPVKMKIWWRLQFLLLFCWQYRILFRRLRTFNSCNNFPNNHSPPCRLLSLSLLFSLRNHHQASNLLLWFTQISTFSFSSRLFSALPLSLSRIGKFTLSFSRLSRKSFILEIEKNFQLVRFSSTRNSQTVKLFIRRHSAKLFKKYLKRKRKAFNFNKTK